MKRKFFNLSFISLLVFCALITAANAQWKQLDSGANVNLTGIKILSPSSAIVIGEKGTILETADTGYTWQRINLNIKNNLNAISGSHSFYSWGNSVIAIAGDSVILISNDSGSTWQIQNKPYVFTSVDNGFTTPLVKESAIRKAKSFFPDSSLIFGTSDGKIFYTTDEGKTWQDTLLSNSRIVSINFDLYGFVPIGSGSGSRILAATNYDFIKGDITQNTWKKYDVGIFIPWQNITSGDLAYNYKFLLGNGGEVKIELLLLRKEENDSTWTNVSQNLPIDLLPNKIKNFGYASFICGRLGKILRSTDNGDSWIEETTPTKESLNDIQFYGSDIGYAVGDSGTILYTDNGGITAIKEKSENIPAEFKLYQNYPNPFNPSTVISWQLAVRSYVTLKVYSVLGREVATLVNGVEAAGRHKVEFNADNLASGIYFYKLTFGSHSITKKMLLLK